MKNKQNLLKILTFVILSLGLSITAANRLLGSYFWGRSFFYQVGIILIPTIILTAFLFFHFVKSKKTIRLFAIYLSFVIWMPIFTYEIAWKALPPPQAFNNHYLQIDEIFKNNVNAIEGLSDSGNRVMIKFKSGDTSRIVIPYDLREVTFYFSCGPNGQNIESKVDGEFFTLPLFCQQVSETSKTLSLHPTSIYIFLSLLLCLFEWASSLLLSILILDLFNFNLEKITENTLLKWIKESDITENPEKPEHTIDKRSLIVLISFIAVIFFLILELNNLTALLADDYVQSFNNVTGDRIQSLKDIFPVIYDLYYYWTGRLFIHFLCYLVIIINKNVFNIVNSFFYIHYLVLIYLFSTTGSIFKNAFLNLVFVSFLIWFFTPVFGETVLWRSGGPTYVWNLCIILTAMLPFFLYFRKIYKIPDRLSTSILFFFLGFISGMGQENSSAALLFYLVFMVLYFLLIRNETKKWMFAEILGCWSGYWFLILAPGNVIRANNFEEPGFLGRISMVFSRFKEDLLPLLILIAILFIISWLIRKSDHSKQHVINIQIPVFILCSLISLIIMVFAKWYPQRASFGPVGFLIIAVGIYFREIAQRILKFGNRFLLAIFFLTTFSISYINAYSDHSRTFSIWTERLAIIEDSKGKGVDTVTVEIIRSTNPHNPFSSITDISENPEGWPNYLIAKYYGIKEVKGSK